MLSHSFDWEPEGSKRNQTVLQSAAQVRSVVDKSLGGFCQSDARALAATGEAAKQTISEAGSGDTAA
jgi:hypothetical protein